MFPTSVLNPSSSSALAFPVYGGKAGSGSTEHLSPAFLRAHRALVLPCVVLLAGLIVSGWLWSWTAELGDREAVENFDAEAADARDALDRRIQLHIELLRGLQAMFHASPEVSRKQFRDYLQSVDVATNYPGVRAIQFARRVTAARKTEFERAVRQDTSLVSSGYPDFQIKPAGIRPEYVVVDYNEPMQGNEAAFGHDQAYEPKRREVMERARDSGQPAASAPITLVQDTSKEPAFVMRVPVYRPGLPRQTLEQRREAFIGQLSGVFRVRDLVRGDLSTSRANLLHVTVRDEGLIGATTSAVSEASESPLFESGTPVVPTRAASPAASYSKTFKLDVAGRQWSLHIARARPNALAQPLPLTILLASLAATGLLFWVLLGLSSQRARAMLLAQQMTAELRDTNARLHSVVDTAVDAIIVVDRHGTIESVNPAALQMLGYRIDQLVGRNVQILVAGPFREQYHNYLTRYLESGDKNFIGVGREVEAVRADGSMFPIEVTVSEMTVDGARKFTAIVRDITERRTAEEKIRRLAHHDALTELPNRTLLQDRLAVALERAKREHGKVGLMFIDLDRFKAVNDSLGHGAGDEILKQVADRLKACVRKSDTVARTGGDEFVVVLPDIRSSDDCGVVARHVLRALAQPCRLGNHDLFVTPSIGISVYPQDGEDASQLMQRADAAMYQAKQNGRNNFQYFTQAMNSRASRQLALENGLRRALDRGEFRLHFQPKVDLASERIVGAEALLRWRHPTLGLIPPAEFIPIAEDTGLIVPIGHWVLRSACAQAHNWRSLKRSEFQMAVNLSPRQFIGEELLRSVADALGDFELEPSALNLEITESMVMHDAEQAIAILQQLKLMGVGIAIDDFGTGHSSLSYLKRFPIDELKIDRSFVGDITTDPNGPPIVSAIVAMAHRLNLRVVAEGVETPQQLEFLRGQACDQAQGYLFGRPAPAEEFDLDGAASAVPAL